MKRETLERASFLVLAALVSLAFSWILWPFFGTIFWAIVLAIVLAPVYRRMVERLPQRATLASLATVVICVLLVIAPLGLLSVTLIHEATQLYQQAGSEQVDFSAYLQKIESTAPSWLLKSLGVLGLGDVAALREALSAGARYASRFLAARAFNIGQGTFDLVLKLGLVLYLLFFLLRDGAALARRIEHAVPIAPARTRELFLTFVAVIHATVKGTVVIALVQGVMGAIAFALVGIPAAVLCGALMALLSLLPVVGSALVWAPIALYFLVTGAAVKGLALVVFGVVVIGLVDNFLRPMLVGKGAKMPDYLVLMSTLGGIALFGFSGFVVGPVVAALFVATWEQFTKAKDALDHGAA